jgi:hypothetical protein
VTHSKAVLTGKFTTMSTHLRKLERSQINNLMIHPKPLEKQEDNPKKVIYGKIIKIQAETNELETKKEYNESRR